MGKIAAALAALRYGSSLTDVEVWKHRQNLLNALLGLLGAAAVFLPVEVTHEDLAAIAGGIAAIAGVLNAYLTTATSARVGLSPRRAPPVRPDDPASAGLDNPGP